MAKKRKAKQSASSHSRRRSGAKRGAVKVNRKRPRHHMHYNKRRSGHRRRMSRNPSFRGAFGQVIPAFKSAVVITFAAGATTFVANKIPVGGTSLPVTVAKRVAIGLGLYYIAKKFMPRQADNVLIGSMLSPAASLIAMIPGASAIMGPTATGVSSYWAGQPGMGTYLPRMARPALPAAAAGARPRPGAGMGAYYPEPIDSDGVTN